MSESFSVLLPIYRLTNLDHFRATLASVEAQTLLPSEVVVVIDGPIPKDISAELECWHGPQSRLTFNFIFLKVNQGLGISLNAGLEACRHQLIARLDADDIATPDRFLRQVQFMEANPDIDVLGSWMTEFDTDSDTPNSEKIVPQQHKEIVAYAHSRNPMNHPTIMFRKEPVISSGGYQEMPFFEDYFLWVRMMISGYKFANISECLLQYRMDEGFYARRKGIEYLRHQYRFFRSLYKLGFIDAKSFIMTTTKRSIPFILPLQFRKLIYQYLRSYS